MSSDVVLDIGGFREGVGARRPPAMPPKMPKVALCDLTVSTKMPGKYGIRRLKYPKKFWGGASAPYHIPPPTGRGTPLPTPYP